MLYPKKINLKIYILSSAWALITYALSKPFSLLAITWGVIIYIGVFFAQFYQLKGIYFFLYSGLGKDVPVETDKFIGNQLNSRMNSQEARALARNYTLKKWLILICSFLGGVLFIKDRLIIPILIYVLQIFSLWISVKDVRKNDVSPY